MLRVRPFAVAGHVEPIGHRLSPLRCLCVLAPVVIGACGLLQLTDGDVSVDASVSVVAGLFDHDDTAHACLDEYPELLFPVGNTGYVAMRLWSTLPCESTTGHHRGTDTEEQHTAEGDQGPVLETGGAATIGLDGAAGHAGQLAAQCR